MSSGGLKNIPLEREVSKKLTVFSRKSVVKIASFKRRPKIEGFTKICRKD